MVAEELAQWLGKKEDLNSDLQHLQKGTDVAMHVCHPSNWE